ncbi:MAG: hypothetical protein HYZ21_14730 [Chloroflexi bacterium]|nr:hypothetical protein [Chloroflexota bacterium]
MHFFLLSELQGIFNFFLLLQRKVRLKAAVPGGDLRDKSCAGDGAGRNLALEYYSTRA